MDKHGRWDSQGTISYYLTKKWGDTVSQAVIREVTGELMESVNKAAHCHNPPWEASSVYYIKSQADEKKYNVWFEAE